MKDYEYMSRAIELAKMGAGWSSPNPMVGAVIVKDGRIIGEGYHRKYGSLHAERDALKNCTEDPEGATIYVTLEPCCHYGKQPPCTDAIIEAGIKRVVMGSPDPNPLVAGKGIRILREHGIEVTEGIMVPECREFNDVFFHYITTGFPFVAMKYAMTMDGKIACYTGESKWVTGEKAREHVQTLRNRYRGIMVGINTVLKDDPMLNCRMPGGRSPVRIICDSKLRLPLDSQIVKTAGEYETIVACCVDDKEAIRPYEEAGITVVNSCRTGREMKNSEAAAGVIEGEEAAKKSQIDLKALFKLLGEMKIDSILVEGGADINWSVMSSGCVNKVYTYIAPKMFGGAQAKSPVSGQGYKTPGECLKLKDSKLLRLGDDILIESSVE